jgi:iron complex transport system substrate-binding protein
LRRILNLSLLLAGPLLWAAAPQRIVSTAPSITDMLFALGLGPNVVGVTDYCRFPDEAKSKPKVGSFLQPDYERILALRPDLVLVIKNPIGVTQRLRSMGVRAEELDQDSTEAIFTSIRRIGELTGRTKQSQALEANLRGELGSIRKRVEGRKRTSVLFLVGRAPGTLQNMVGAGKGSYLDELLFIAGGENILNTGPAIYPKVGMETVLARDPEVILDMGDYAHQSGVSPQRQAEEQALWKKYPQLRAVRSGRVKAVVADHFVVPGPRMAEAAREFLAALHPEVAGRP